MFLALFLSLMNITILVYAHHNLWFAQQRY
nr:MAG TPA: hypothetical protein [Caudoviricetes sp.]